MEAFLEDGDKEGYISTAQRWFSRMQGGSLRCLRRSAFTRADERLAKTRYGGLPIYDDESPYDPVPLELNEWCEHFARDIPELAQLVSDVRNYEHFGPPHVSRSYRLHYTADRAAQGDNGFYRRGPPVRDALIFLPDKLPDDEQLIVWVNSAMPSAMYQVDHDEHRRYAAFIILDWFRRTPLRDFKTLVDYGGPGGVRLGLCLILRLLIQAETMASAQQKGSNWLPEVTLTIYAKQCVINLSDQIAASRKILSGTRDKRRRSQNRLLDFVDLDEPGVAREAPGFETPFADEHDEMPGGTADILEMDQPPSPIKAGRVKPRVSIPDHTTGKYSVLPYSQ